MTSKSKRATIYLEPELHHTLRLKAVQMDRSISDLVNQAIRDSLFEDAEDLTAFEARDAEPDLDFEQVLLDMKKRGKI